MEIEVINNLNHFHELKECWDHVYAKDAHSNFFLSWPWLNGWLSTTKHEWLILALKPDGEVGYVAFLPLTAMGVRKSGAIQASDLHLGGKPFADYSGFLCLPEHESEAIPVFANYLKERLPWNNLLLADVMDSRLELFLKCFSGGYFKVEETSRMPCPYVELPDSWEKYLRRCLGRSTRRHVRKSLREIEKQQELEIRETRSADFGCQMEALHCLWLPRFENSQDHGCKDEHRIFRCWLDHDCLEVAVLWHKEIPVAGLATFSDKQKGYVSAFRTAFAPSYSNLKPGMALFGHSIRRAIEEGHKTYDFLRGGHNYKFLFGAKVRHAKSVNIMRRDFGRSLRQLSKGFFRRVGNVGSVNAGTR